MKIKNTLLLITDKAMRKVYNEPCIDSKSVKIIDCESIRRLNFLSKENQILDICDSVYPFLIFGSSNFHHLVALHIKNLYKKIGCPLQLILIDRHMDAQSYNPDTKELHCGNWVSYCFHKGWLRNIIIIGSNNDYKMSSFDHSLIKKNVLTYCQNINSKKIETLIHKDVPTYVSIDTDVLNLPNDWGKGRVSLEELLNASFWNAVNRDNCYGASILGHVTDNRRIVDFLKVSFKSSNKILSKLSIFEIINGFFYTFFTKLWASITTKPLPMAEQLTIMQKIYNFMFLKVIC